MTTITKSQAEAALHSITLLNSDCGSSHETEAIKTLRSYIAQQDARIAQLEAEVKRKDEALNKFAAGDVTVTYSLYPQARGYEVHENCQAWAKAALAPQKDGE